jgi:hypothetical protein
VNLIIINRDTRNGASIKTWLHFHGKTGKGYILFVQLDKNQKLLTGYTHFCELVNKTSVKELTEMKRLHCYS